MLKCAGRFRSTLAVVLLCACAAGGSKVVIVTPEAYGLRSCWIDEDGDLAAFFVLAQEESSGTPYLISTNCIVNAGYSSDGEGILHNLNVVRMVDTHHQLQRTMPNVRIFGNTGPHLPQPSSSSRVYYLKASAGEIPHPSMTLYAPVKIKKMIDIDVNFEGFLGLSREEREGLLRAYRPES